MSSAAGGGTAPSTTAPRAERPRRGDLLELRIESVAHGGAGVGRLDGYVVFVEGAFPGELVRAEIAALEARLRERAGGRGARAEPRPGAAALRPRRPAMPRVAVAAAALRAPARAEAGAGRRRAARGSARLDGFELEPIVPAAEPWRYRNKMEYSFGTVRGRTRSRSASTRRGRWDVVDDARDCMLASERNNAVRNLVRDWCAAAGPGRATTAARGRGFLRNLVVREGRRTGELQVRLVTAEGEFDAEELCAAVRARASRAPTCCGPARTGSPRSTQGGDTEVAGRLGSAARGALRPALSHLAGGVLPDQHRDGRAALRARARVRGS